MTTALLDTHAFVWAATEPERLGRPARQLIEDPTTSLLVSSATAWEISTKVRLGRFPEAELLAAQYRAVVDALRAEDLVITSTDALRAGSLRWDHRDPFDRMLAAQALLSGAVFVTRDKSFSALAGLDIVW